MALRNGATATDASEPRVANSDPRGAETSGTSIASHLALLLAHRLPPTPLFSLCPSVTYGCVGSSGRRPAGLGTATFAPIPCDSAPTQNVVAGEGCDRASDQLKERESPVCRCTLP